MLGQIQALTQQVGTPSVQVQQGQQEAAVLNQQLARERQRGEEMNRLIGAAETLATSRSDRPNLVD
eukprot:7969229-Karenia_brevis.AAC.1